MALKLYNTLTRKKQNFKPAEDNLVRIYVCGPTIYDFGHLGHGRSAVSFDIFRRYLLYKGYKVKFVMNYTDIDDKMINRANEEKTTVAQLAERFAKIYDEDYKKLNILPPDVNPRPTQHIDEIIDLIKELENKKKTYVVQNDGVYFDISSFKKYGQLSWQKQEDLKAGARIEASEQKKSPHDFVLWKFAKPGEPSWDSPWGKGRPGWHIECSAMSLRYLGDNFDVHGGGQDLIFPHHENEIAQAEGAGHKFARGWMHNGFVTVSKEKMSKSLKNFTTLREVFENYEPLVIRFLVLRTQYREPIDFSLETLDDATKNYNKLRDFMAKLKDYSAGKDNSKVAKLIEIAKKKFENSLDDDLNISAALAAIYEFMNKINKLYDAKQMSSQDAKLIYEQMLKFDTVLGLRLGSVGEEKISEDLKLKIKQREEARKNKDWAASDRIRDELKAQGIILEDQKDGSTRWKKI